MKKKGAEIVWECLVREGVEVVFGYPGGANMPIYDAMLNYPVHHVLVRHEQGAAHMADGYARASGKVANKHPASRPSMRLTRDGGRAVCSCLVIVQRFHQGRHPFRTLVTERCLTQFTKHK